jgi:membrane protein DedA with SNARE-associated domain
LEHILTTLTNWISGMYGTLGYWAIVLFMGIESACIPLPSEVIMPVAGYFIFTELPGGQHFGLWWTAVAGAGGCVWGSLVAYYAGLYGGRPFVAKYGKYVLIRKRDLDRADYWYNKYGIATVFFARLLPIIRTFISFPAGMHKVNLPKFVAYTFIGSFPWCLALSYFGMILGKRFGNLEQVRGTVSGYFHGADVVIAVVLVIMFALWLKHHLKPDEEEVVKAEEVAAR